MKVLVDSSVWIDFLRSPEGVTPELGAALRQGKAVICPIVWVEISSGIRGKREESVFQKIQDVCPSLEIDEAVWRAAAALARESKKAGLNCPLADVLIVACAKRHGADVMHRDKHIGALLKIGI